MKTGNRRLWTYQSPEFSLIDGVYDPEKSKYYGRFVAEYLELWHRVKTRELVWCFTSADDCPWKNGHCEWELEVPESDFVQIVDSMVWAGILGAKDITPPKRLRVSLRNAAMSNSPDDIDGWCAQKVQELLHPPGDPWESLFLEDASDLRADILLKHPVEPAWIVSTKQY